MYKKKKQYKFSFYELNKNNLALDYLLMPFLKTDLDAANFSKEQQRVLLSEFNREEVDQDLLKKIEAVNLGNYTMSSYGFMVLNDTLQKNNQDTSIYFDGDQIRGLLMILARLRWFQKIGKLSDEDFDNYSTHILRKLVPHFESWQDYIIKMRYYLDENSLHFPNNNYNYLLFTNFDYISATNRRKFKKMDWLTVEPKEYHSNEKAHHYEGMKFSEEDEKALTIMAIYTAWSKKAPYYLYPRTAAQYTESLAVLTEGWNIHSRDELLKTTNQLVEGRIHYETMNTKDSYISSTDMKKYIATLKYGRSEKWEFESEIERFQFEKEYQKVLTAFNEAHIQIDTIPTENYLGVQRIADMFYLMASAERILKCLLHHEKLSVIDMMELGLLEGGFNYLDKLNSTRQASKIKSVSFNELPNIKAWELCRAGNIMLHGYLVGFVELEEFFDRLSNEILPIVREEFEDWDQYLISFLTGRFLWDAEVTLNSFDEFYDRIDRYIYNSEDQVLFNIWEKYPLSEL
ncbi:DUF1266 domain-containing protein [Vagococcus fessus]|nr:DUF1266 domain-containing protein [Vagococcus fessus]